MKREWTYDEDFPTWAAGDPDSGWYDWTDPEEPCIICGELPGKCDTLKHAVQAAIARNA